GNGILAAQGTSTLSRLLDWSRILQVLTSFMKQGVRVGSIPIALLPVYALFLRYEKAQLLNRAISSCGLTLMLVFARYFVIFLITPFDLAWHLQTALARLFLQLWPSIVFVSLLVIARPQAELAQQPTIEVAGPLAAMQEA